MPPSPPPPPALRIASPRNPHFPHSFSPREKKLLHNRSRTRRPAVTPSLSSHRSLLANPDRNSVSVRRSVLGRCRKSSESRKRRGICGRDVADPEVLRRTAIPPRLRKEEVAGGQGQSTAPALPTMALRATLCALLLALSTAPINAAHKPFPEIFGWPTMDFEFPSDSARQSALRSGYFIPGNSQPIDVQAVGDRVFITMPRWKEGIPATLATVPLSPPECAAGGTCSPLLNPYPNWSWNSGDKGCDGLTSVFRVNLDKCGRLWVLDSGAVTILAAEGRKTLCPAQLMSFDLNTNRLIRRYRFPKAAIKESSLLVTVALDTVSTADDCLNTYAYSADVTAYGLVVTDTKRGNSWRVENKLFYPYPTWGTFDINGGVFDLMDGVIALAIHPELNPQTRRLYFHAMASARENYVPTNVLRNSSRANAMPREFVMSSGEKPSQSAASAFDSRGILFFGLLTSNSLACYNPSQPHIPSNIHAVARNDQTMQFASGLKVDSNDKVWMMASKFSEYFLGRLDNNEVNFRVLAAPSRDLTRGTPCEEGVRGGGGSFNPIRFGN